MTPRTKSEWQMYQVFCHSFGYAPNMFASLQKYKHFIEFWGITP